MKNITALFLLLFFFTKVSSDCIVETIALNTIFPGHVQITHCPDIVVKPGICTAETVSELMLIKSLIAQYNSHAFCVVAHVDSVFRFPNPGPSMQAESIRIHIDTVFKGDIQSRKLWFTYQLWEDAGTFLSVKDRRYIGFFDSVTTTNYLGLGKPYGCDDAWKGAFGYFIENGEKIVNNGRNALLGVSFPFKEFLNAISMTYLIYFSDQRFSISPYVPVQMAQIPVDYVLDSSIQLIPSHSSVITRNFFSPVRVRGYFLIDSIPGFLTRDTAFFITHILDPLTAIPTAPVKQKANGCLFPSLSLMLSNGSDFSNRYRDKGDFCSCFDIRGRLVYKGTVSEKSSRRLTSGLLIQQFNK